MMQMVTLFREVWSENEPWQWLTAAATALVVLVIALGLSVAFVFLPMGVARLTGTPVRVWGRASATGIDVHGYDLRSQLGADRWLGIVAAYRDHGSAKWRDLIEVRQNETIVSPRAIRGSQYAFCSSGKTSSAAVRSPMNSE